MSANPLFGLSELQQKAIRLYVAQEIAAAIGGSVTAGNVAFSSTDFTATNVAAALQELFDTKMSNS